MALTDVETDKQSRLSRLPGIVGVVVVSLSLLAGLATYTILTGLSPIKPTPDIITWLLGGNLTVLAHLVGTPYLPDFAGRILFLEDVHEGLYRIDRMLTSLRIGGHFERASAVVFGDFDACGPGPDGVTVDDVLADFCRRVTLPVASGAPFGHADRNEAFVHGEIASLDGDVLTFRNPDA